MLKEENLELELVKEIEDTQVEELDVDNSSAVEIVLDETLAQNEDDEMLEELESVETEEVTETDESSENTNNSETQE